MKRARARRDGKQFRRLTAETHALLFAPVGYPRLLKFVNILVGPVGLRYDRVFVDNFDDTWDLMLELAVRRYEAVAEGDADAAVSCGARMPRTDRRAQPVAHHARTRRPVLRPCRLIIHSRLPGAREFDADIARQLLEVPPHRHLHH